jgi:hypothetical protein
MFDINIPSPVTDVVKHIEASFILGSKTTFSDIRLYFRTDIQIDQLLREKNKIFTK